MTLGPIMLDLRGTVLEADEREMLTHPLVGGVILFSRNFENQQQVAELANAIHSVRKPQLLLAVDQEGGRVQRFREGFSLLPPCRQFGEIYEVDQKHGLALAKNAGWLMASELLGTGIDFSFAPVLDLYKGISQVIGDRAFHKQPQDVAALATYYMLGMKQAGMSAVGKHFPGHGDVSEDSHHAIPIDNRRFEDIQMDDLIAFRALIDSGIAALMPAHVIYPQIDEKPAGFSSIWLKQILRKTLNFKGAIFSDDISMAGAEVAGDYVARTQAALIAGCDMVLICNQQEQAIKVLDTLNYEINPTSSVRLMRMQGKFKQSFDELCCTADWKEASDQMLELIKTPELNLGDDQI